MIKSFTDYLSLSDFDHSAKSCREIVCFLHLFLHLCKKTRIFRLFYASIRTVCGSCQIVSNLSVQAFCLLGWRWNELLWNRYVLYTFLTYAAEILKTVWVQAHVGSNPTGSARTQKRIPEKVSAFVLLRNLWGIRTRAWTEATVREGETVLKCYGRCYFSWIIQMWVNISSCREDAVPQPLLNLLHRYIVCKKQTGAAVTEVVETYFTQTVFLKESWKLST